MEIDTRNDMEVIRGACHARFPMTDSSCIGDARRHAASLADRMSWNDVAAGRIALVINELGSNLVKHASDGELLIAASKESGEIEVLSIDHGPGIENVNKSMSDGFSTAGTPGTGLGAVQRLSDEFDIYSSRPGGTLAVARVRNIPHKKTTDRRAMRVAGVRVTAPGETVSGDAWAAHLGESQADIMLADGLGHGEGAAEAGEAAIDVFVGHPFEDLRETLQTAHASLRMTRGAAVSSIRASANDDKLTLAGAGNVTVRVVSGLFDRSLMAQHGTLGVQIKRLEESSVEWPEHALVVLHSDGIQARWKKEVVLPVMGHDPILVASLLLRDHLRGSDDATVVVLRRAG